VKQATHPAYGPVVFRDRSAGTTFLTRLTIVGRLAEGRVEKFNRRYAATKPGPAGEALQAGRAGERSAR
jgi:ribosomal protein L31